MALALLAESSGERIRSFDFGQVVLFSPPVEKTFLVSSSHSEEITVRLQVKQRSKWFPIELSLSQSELTLRPSQVRYTWFISSCNTPRPLP